MRYLKFCDPPKEGTIISWPRCHARIHASHDLRQLKARENLPVATGQSPREWRRDKCSASLHHENGEILKPRAHRFCAGGCAGDGNRLRIFWDFFRDKGEFCKSRSCQHKKKHLEMIFGWVHVSLLLINKFCNSSGVDHSWCRFWHDTPPPPPIL